MGGNQATSYQEAVPRSTPMSENSNAQTNAPAVVITTPKVTCLPNGVIGQAAYHLASKTMPY
jgi:hypothetical protein